jgi:hypothetical protein
MIDIVNLAERKLIRKLPQVSKYWDRLIIFISIDISCWTLLELSGKSIKSNNIIV